MRLKFDPIKVGSLEVGWWKAHNEKNKPELLRLLVEEHRELYSLTEDEAKSALGSLFEGIDYHDKRDWDGAKKAATKYYDVIKIKTGLNFDSAQMGKLEVGWWMLHDELEQKSDKTRLAEAFALLFATQYGIDPQKLMQAGKYKAEATYEHDLAEDPRTQPADIEDHWQKAGELLIAFWSELKTVVNQSN